MNKTSKLLFKTAAIFQLLTGAIHATSLFSDKAPSNDTEKQMMDLLENYRMELGAGFTPTLSEIFISMSACFSLLLFFGGMINLFLLKKCSDDGVVKGVLNINLLVFTMVFILMCVFTFLPPIVCTGLIFVSLVLARITFKRD